MGRNRAVGFNRPYAWHERTTQAAVMLARLCEAQTEGEGDCHSRDDGRVIATELATLAGVSGFSAYKLLQALREAGWVQVKSRVGVRLVGDPARITLREIALLFLPQQGGRRLRRATRSGSREAARRAW